MKTLAFEGHSDDTFGEYLVTNDDYDCCASGALIVFRVTAADESDKNLVAGLHVCGQYSGAGWQDEQPGCWLVGLQQLEEYIPLPDWPMRWKISDRGYSPRLEIDVPDNVRLVCLNRTGSGQ